MVAQAVSPALPTLDDFCHGLPDARSPSRLDKLRPLFGEIAQDFNERFREEAR